jgi:hypothetical protein
VLVDLWSTWDVSQSNDGVHGIPIVNVGEFPGPKMIWNETIRTNATTTNPTNNRDYYRWPQILLLSVSLAARVDHVYRSSQWWTEQSSISSVTYLGLTLNRSLPARDLINDDDTTSASQSYLERQREMLITLRHQLALPYRAPSHECHRVTKARFYSTDHMDQRLAATVFKNQSHGTFVDVGSLDESVTLHLEESRCWRGICIQPIDELYTKIVESRQCLAYHGIQFTVNFHIDFGCLSSSIYPHMYR